MSVLFKKLNHKPGEPILVLQAPASFEPELAALAGTPVLRALPPGVLPRFTLAFVIRQAELDALATALVAQTEGDAVLWFAYPKKSSKRFTCEFDRDHGWAVLDQAGYQSVRMVAIDEDWSALRFRKAQYSQPRAGQGRS